MLSYDEIPGVISAQALAEHLKLLANYEKMLGKTDNALFSTFPIKPDMTNPLHNHMKVQSFALNSIILHNLYFNNITPNGCESSSDKLHRLFTAYKSRENLLHEVKTIGMVSRGWVMLGQSLFNGEFRIFSIDSHDEGSPVCYNPILILDTWEHAYWMDWGTNKSGYLERIAENVNWDVVSRRLA